jgi:hypothetical protein
MRKEYFQNAEKIEKSGGSLQNIISFITDNKDLIGANANFISSAVDVGKSIKGAAKKPEDYKKSDKELIEEMKVERVYRDLQDLRDLRNLSKKGAGFKII